jgi:hypothetical protein
VIAKLILFAVIVAVVALAELAGWLRDRRAARRSERHFLENMARDYGLEPMRGESNAALRFRLRAHLTRRPGSATLQGLIDTAGQVRGVDRVLVVDEGPGMLSMYVEPNDADVIDRVRAALRDEAPIGLLINVQGAGADDAA